VVDYSFPIIYHIDDQGLARVSLVGEFDADNHVALTHYLLGVVHDPAVARILVDMRATTFIDSSAIRAIENARAAADVEAKPLHVVNPERGVRRVFEILALEDLLTAELVVEQPVAPADGD